MLILILGDIHGNWEAANFIIEKAIKENKNISHIFAMGDFGLWFPTNNRGDISQYHPKTDLPIHFLDGNHDVHPMLREFSKHPHAPNIIYQPRGSVLEIDGLRMLFMGGASSIDKDWRIAKMNAGCQAIWWPEESITREEFEKAMAVEGPIDAIFAHEKADQFDYKPMSHHTYSNVGKSDRIALQQLVEKFMPRWYFHGHWHLADKGEFSFDGKTTRWYCAPEVAQELSPEYLIWDGKQVYEYTDY